MKPTALFTSALLLPATLALDISSHLTTSTTLLCSTLYSTSSAPFPLPTSTSTLPSPLDLSPVILHNYTTSTTTITPKPFSTLFSVLATKTVTTEAQATNGTFFVTETRFGTSTHWEHETTTKTETKTRFLTSRTTEWVEKPTGFVGVREGTASSAGTSSASSMAKQSQKRKRSATHPHSKRQNKPSSKPKLVRPTAGKYAVQVACEQHVAVHTTEVLLLTASKLATVTLRPETVYKNRTVYGTITTTMLVSSSTTTSLSSSGSFSTTPPAKQDQRDKQKRDSLAFSIPTNSHSRGPLASLALALLSTSTSSASPSSIPSSILTNKTTVTKTPYTISFTYTRTLTSTSTHTLHATTTITSFAACATGNLLSQTSNNKLINGISSPLTGEGVEAEVLQTETPEKCCEECITRQGCMWSIWQAEGREKGSCYLTLLSNTSSPQKKSNIDASQKKKKKRNNDAGEDGGKGEEGKCPTQQAKAVFGYSGANGEVRYVVSNGLCGSLSEA